MKLVCPSCGATHSSDAWTADADARASIAAVAELGELAPLVLRYIGLFRPGKRALAWPRARRLVDELLALVKAGKVRRNGRDWSAPASAWRYSIDVVLQRRDQGRLKLPLDTHGYLLEVICGEADKAEAREEQVAEQQLRTGRPASAPSEPARAIDWVEHEFNAYLADVKRLNLAPSRTDLAVHLESGRRRMGLPPMGADELEPYYARADERLNLDKFFGR
jgi:hypothetical protein